MVCFNQTQIEPNPEGENPCGLRGTYGLTTTCAIVAMAGGSWNPCHPEEGCQCQPLVKLETVRKLVAV